MRTFSQYKSLLLIVGALLVVVFSGTMSHIPLYWGDTPAYINSALKSLSAGSIELHQGVNLGYVYFLLSFLRMNWELESVVLVQHLFWCFTIAVFMFTSMRIFKTNSLLLLLPVGVLASYPGIQLYQNILITESIYISLNCLVVCFLALAITEKSRFTKTLFLLFALAAATAASVTKAQGLAPFSVVFFVAMLFMFRFSIKSRLVISVALTISIAFNFANYQLRTHSPDTTSKLFASKTMFCLHQDIILQSQAIKTLAQNAFGKNAKNILERMNRNFHSDEGEYKTLGFYADPCQFDKVLDQMAIDSHPQGVTGLVRWYSDAFWAGIREQPFSYIRKIIKQFVYGLSMSFPPHQSGSRLPSLTELAQELAKTFDAHNAPQTIQTEIESISSPLLAHSSVSVYVYRLLSLLMGLTLILSIVLFSLRHWRKQWEAVPALVVSLLWFSQISGIAATHTLDIWRYIVPVVPAGIVVMMLVSSACYALYRELKHENKISLPRFSFPQWLEKKKGSS